MTAQQLTELKQTAADLGLPFKQALFHLFAEEFLRRLSSAKCAEEAVLCGGYLTYAFSAMIARPFEGLVIATTLSPKAFVQAVLAVQTDSGVNLECLNASGNTVQIMGHWGAFCLPFFVRVLSDLPPKRETATRGVPILLDGFSAPKVSMLGAPAAIGGWAASAVQSASFADCSQKLFDLYFLVTQLDFDGAPIAKALQQHKVTEDDIKNLLAAPDFITAKKWRQTVKNAALSPDYETALQTVGGFLLPPATQGELFRENWSAERGAWV